MCERVFFVLEMDKDCMRSAILTDYKTEVFSKTQEKRVPLTEDVIDAEVATYGLEKDVIDPFMRKDMDGLLYHVVFILGGEPKYIVGGGCFMYDRRMNQSAILSSFFVTPTLRKRGLGGIFFSSLVAILKRHDAINKVELVSRPEAVGFWRKMGFSKKNLSSCNNLLDFIIAVSGNDEMYELKI